MSAFAQSYDFPIACFRFQLRVTQPISLPTNKGSTFHGGFGHALARIGPRFRDYFFASSAKARLPDSQEPPKPFMLIPPLEEQTEYAPGDRLQFGLILFGEAIGHFMIAFAAFECLGRELGLGRSQGKFSIESIEQLTLDASQPVFEGDTWQPLPQPVRACGILDVPQARADSLTLFLTTRLRLKHDNKLVRDPPQFAVFLDRLLGRINSLSALYGRGILVPPDQKRRLLQQAVAVQIDRSATNARWVDWDRPAKLGRDKMSFGGLLGEIGYKGELQHFLPWLALGQWTGIGGKTSFGLGLYSMAVQEDERYELYEE